MISRLLIKLHRVLGTILSILFLMWFLSGMVMMYHTYARVQDSQRLEFAEKADGNALPMEELLDRASLPTDFVTSVVMRKTAGKNTLAFRYADGTEKLINAKNGEVINRYQADDLGQIANRWHTGEASLKDTLNAIDIWLVGVYPVKEWPVYHYTFNGDDKAELYLSSRTGEALQYTTASSRFWSWIGAIPHWIYIKQLRATGRQPWTDVVLWFSGIGAIMCLLGLVVGIRSAVLAYRSKKKKLTPYVKPLYKWHHVLGMVFGLFALTWVFSGYMSLQRVPEWMVKVHEAHNAQADVKGSSVLPLAGYRYDYRKVAEQLDVKRLTWTAFNGHPIYKVENAAGVELIDALNGQPYVIDEEKCQGLAQKLAGEKQKADVEKLDEYDNYYISLSGKLALPVWRLTIDDEDGSAYYINPVNGNVRYYNHNTRLRKWLYGGLHSFSGKFFLHHPVLRVVLMWLLLLGGAALSATGVFLGIRRCWKWMASAS